MADDSEWMKLPADEKVQHKVWKARLAGYEAVIKLFPTIGDEKSPEFTKYLGLIKKFVTDSNAVAQEKGVEAAIAYIQNAAIAHKTAPDVISGVISKCISASKTKTREGGKEIIMLYVEAEKQEAVVECLVEGLGDKNPKILCGCVQILREALRDFGNKIIQIKPLLKFLPKLMEDRDKNVREEAKLLVVEMYRWVGAAIKPKLVDFKPVQVTALEAEFAQLPNEKAQQVRFLKSQQDLKEKMEEKAAMAEAGCVEEEEEAEEVDPDDLLEAVNVLAALPKDFFEKIEAKKWQERKEALEAATKLCDNPKIEAGDHGNLVRALLKVIGKDTNVMLVALGGRCLGCLAKGLKKKFSPYATNCFSVIVEKFKEKKPAVVAALRDAVDHVYLSISLEPLQEEILTFLENKNPNIKAETASFLARAFSRLTIATLPKKQLKAFCTALLKTVADTSQEVREGSFMAIGTAMKVVTEKNILAYLVDVDDLKMQKIKEACEKTVLLNAKGEPRSGGAAKPAAPAAAKGGPTIVKPGAPPRASGPARPKTAPAKSGGAKSGGPPKKSAAKKAAPVEEKTEKILSDEDFIEKATDFLTADVFTKLESSNWKERLGGMEKFRDTIQKMDKADIPCQVCVRAVAKKPGFKDNNFQVLKLRVGLISHLAQNANFTKTSAEFCLGDLIEKVADVKNGAAVQEAFSYIAEATSLEYVAGEVMKAAFAQKNPKNQSEALTWMSKSLTEFGLKVQVKPHIQYLKLAFASTNPAVRSAGIVLLSTLFLYMGPQLRMLFDGEKAALLQQIDAELEKVKGQKPPAPTRGVKPSDDAGDDDDEDGGGAGGGDEADDNPADLIPRNNVGDQFTPELIESMSDKGWKVRGEALQKVISILNEAKFITGNLGPLPEAIKSRLVDANKNLVTTTVGICATLATNMGPHCKQHIKVIGPAIISVLGDGKPTLRAAAVGALNAWVDQTTLTPLVECEALSDALKLENPNLKQELLGWLCERLPNHKQLPKDEMKLCIPHLLVCLEDRNPEVRKKGQEALVPFMIHVGYDSVFKATSKLKPSSKDQIVQIIEKARENLPAKQPKVKKAAPASKPAAVSRPASDNFDEPEPDQGKKEKSPVDDVVESKPKAPGKTKAKSAAPPSKKKKVEEDLSPPIATTETKDKRFKDEKNMKTLKWNFIEPRLEFVEQLRTQMEKNFNKPLMDQLFHNDFKSHIKAIETLQKCLEGLKEEQVNNLDLILKWFTLRFYDTNPSMLNKGLNYLSNLFNVLIDMDYSLHEFEATSFVPYLIIKVGENKDNVRRDVRALFKLVYKVYPASKMFTFISDGIKSKNSKQRTECLEELGYLIEMYGIAICQPTPAQALKTIASQISDRDAGVRNAALNSTVVAYIILGDDIYKYIGTLKDKEQSYLDERIKRSSKNKSAASAAKPESRPKTAPAPATAQRSATQGSIARPACSMPKSKSSNSVKKEFQLEIEEDTERESLSMPQLAEYKDLEYLCTTVEYPKIMARPPSPGPKFLSSVDASNTVNYVISQITNREIQTCIKALAQIDEVLKDNDKVTVMEDHVEQLLVAMSMQLKMAYSTHMGDEDTSKDDVIRLYRCLLGTLLSLLQNSGLAVQASKDMLRELISNLITMLLDSRLMELEDGPQVIRSVNVLVVKIVEKSDQTNVLCALIRLLQDGVASETCSNKFLELIMKCLWKMVKMIPDIVDYVNLDHILFDIHQFLRSFPTHSWKERSNDLPLRTIKTILHSLGKIKGPKIMSHLGQIDVTETSEVKTYLQKVLRTEGGHQGDSDVNGMEENRAPKSGTKTKRLSKSTHDMLTEIFKKIGSKENTKEGLVDLFNFKKQFPDADVEPFTKKSSQFFQNYIERGLKAIEKEQSGLTQQVSDNGDIRRSQPLQNQESKIQKPKFGQDSNEGKTASDPIGEARFYMEKLRQYRTNWGLDSNDQTIKTHEPSPPPVVGKPEPSPDTEESKSGDSDSDNITNAKPATSVSQSKDVSDLKARLARLKQMANS